MADTHYHADLSARNRARFERVGKVRPATEEDKMNLRRHLFFSHRPMGPASDLKYVVTRK